MLIDVTYWICVIMQPRTSSNNSSHAPSGRLDSPDRNSWKESNRRDSRESRSGGVTSPLSPVSRASNEAHAAINAVRHLVSGNRSRYVDSEYDLDLTYITRRIIAMAFPGEDLLGPFSSLIRNDLRSVLNIFC